MNLRCDLCLDGEERKLQLVCGLNESLEHQALRLAGYLLFWAQAPVPDAGFKHPALAGYDFLPDLLGLDESGAIVLWVECGSTTMNKMTKLTRRLSQARIVVMKETGREAARLREELKTELGEREAKVEVLAWPDGQFREWVAALKERNEIYGESGGLLINAVVNGQPFAVELQRF